MNTDMNGQHLASREDPDVDSAWVHMRSILDEKMPVKDKRSKRLIFYFYRVAAMLLLLLCVLVTGDMYLTKNISHLKKYEIKIDTINTSLSTTKNNDAHLSTVAYEEAEQQHQVLKNSSLKPILQNTKAHQKKYLSVTSGKNRNATYLASNPSPAIHNSVAVEYPISKQKENGVNISVDHDTSYGGHFKITTAQTKQVSDTNDLAVKDSTVKNTGTANNDKIKKKKRVLGVEMGAYYNNSGSVLSIYPIAALTFPVQQKSFVSFGVGFNSQVNLHNFISREFTLLNDTANQVYFTLDQKKIKKVVYIDLPISFHYSLNSHFIVSAGVQLSVLQNVDIKTEKKIFDFQSDLIQEISPGAISTAGTFTPYPVYAQGYDFMQTNWRFITGLGYHFKNAAIKFIYQQSFNPNSRFTDFDGTRSERRFSIFTLGISCRIK